jgi:3'-phosphoadenosine 5'-phosphosulfate sulfotransferase (PAPS reductase)/FAD synthetase
MTGNGTVPIPEVGMPELLIDDAVRQAIEEGAMVVLNLSGGKDSLLATALVMAMLDRMGHPRSERIAIHADLGRAEWRSTAATVRRQAEEIGLRLVTVKRAAGDMVDRWNQRYRQGIDLYTDMSRVILRGPWSSSKQRFCTPELKTQVIHEYLAATYPGRRIVSVLGIRRAESTRRSTTPVSKRDAKIERASGITGIVWNPIADMGTAAVYETIAELGLTMHEAYVRYGSTRLSCAFCVLGSKADIAASASAPDNADLYRTLVAMEASTGFSFQQNSWLGDIAPGLLDEETLHALGSAKRYAAERREIDVAIGKDFLKGTKEDPWPRRLPTQDEAAAIANSRRLNSSWTGIEFPYQTAAAVTERIGRMLEGRNALQAKKG